MVGMTRRGRAAVLGFVILAVGLQTACDSPTQPGPTVGVAVYEHPDYPGESYTFSSDFHNFDDLHGPCARIFRSVARELGRLRLFRADCGRVDGYRFRA